MKRKFWIGASLGALVVAAMAPWSASQAHDVSLSVSTPEFGFRIGAPAPRYYGGPRYYPAPVYVPPPVVYQPPPPVVYAPAPRYYAPPPVVYGGYGYPYYRAGWRYPPHHRHPHWDPRPWQ